ncbi:MAG: Xaa-Pro aminopeptidase [Gammaproteobacteria bacterium]
MKPEEFARRRRQLARIMEEGSIAIVPSAPERVRSRDIHHDYRQDSDFFYLTGFNEPDSVAVMIPGRDQAEYIIFCRDRDPLKETWDGLRAGPDGAIEQYGADDAFPIGDLDDILPGLMENRPSVYYTMGRHPVFDQQLIGWVNGLRSGGQSGNTHPPHEIIALDHTLHDMRLYKSRAEIVAMRHAAKVASQAHKRAMLAVRPGMHEFELEAEYLHEFRRHAGVPSYPAIVGGGRNGCILHYTENNQILNDGDLVLVDAGCEINYYASDITRTFPVNGRYSEPQRALYDIVLEANIKAIDQVVAGNHWNDVHDAAVKVIAKGLLREGLVSGTLAHVLKTESYREFFMHRTGHWLGIDVHDVGDYKVQDNWRILESGMVLTVEPGIYVAPTAKVDKQWRGIGIRIEDDVAVTSGAPDVLSKHLIKDADAIEALMSQSASLRKSA